MAPGPVTRGPFALEAVAAGTGRDGRVLVGSNREEARLFLVVPGAIEHVDEPTLGRGACGLSPEGLAVHHRNGPGSSPGDVLAAVVTDWLLAVPALPHVEAREAGGGTTWAFRFDRPDPADNHGFGACHAVEIAFVLGSTGPTRWSGTAHRSSRPTPRTRPGWPSPAPETRAPCTAQTRSTGVLTEVLTVVDDPECDERRTASGGSRRLPL